MDKLSIIAAVSDSTPFKKKLSALMDRQRVVFSGLVGSSKSAVIAALSRHFDHIFLVSASAMGALRLKGEVEFFTGKPASFLPVPDPLAGKEIIGERLSIIESWPPLVFASLKAMLSKTSAEKRRVRLSLKKRTDPAELVKLLSKSGHKRFDIVGERGEFCVRGGIVDVFPVNSELPVRIEFAGDQVESIRSFDPFSQRSIEKLKTAVILPAEEREDVPFIGLIPKNALVILDEEAELLRQQEEKYDQVKIAARGFFSSFLLPDETLRFSASPQYLGDFDNLPNDALVVSRHAARLREELPDKKVVEGELGGGFIFGRCRIVSDRELFGETTRPSQKKKAAKEGVADSLLSDLKIGDYVVHENYGIGIYRGMKELLMEGVKQEYLLIEFAQADKLYVPPPMIGLVEKYLGGGSAVPRLSRLCTREWLNTRARVKASVKDITKELLEIYAEREKMGRPGYPQDNIWQKELEATFSFDETPDQRQAIQAVKKDLEGDRPMDRLICGDVGYGKTEVAIRAAAKVISAGRQAAILAPTTILVEQHFNSFKQRFSNLPFVVEMLSRFRSKAEQKKTLKLLETGGADVVIGTHRLLSKDIKFKNLGLLIIDEEQKFGVTHKEKIKKLKKNVDVLTLTATPIPRTLYFSLSGLRPVSMIATPPVDRSPIRTYVVPYSDAIIKEAIGRELDRGGQVYFVHNYVETIMGFAARIKKLAPFAAVAVGHGQMDGKKLEKTMLDFLDRKHDVLVCTSIIESGLDISNVNTILIDQADRLGLSQLYQIRGRVGRSAARAYAYLFYHPAKSMGGQAMERLRAIQEFTALGSGYKLAMRDLEIRGAGNLLGAQQSGHIYEVGFDLYCELLEEAVKEVKGEKVLPSREVEIDIKVEASIPSNYVADDRQRIALYRRMNQMMDLVGVEELKNELIDRFGKIPPPLAALLRLLDLKIKALNAGVKSIKEENNRIRIEWFSKKTVIFDCGSADKITLLLAKIG